MVALALVMVIVGALRSDRPDEGPYHHTTVYVTSPWMGNYTSSGSEHWCATFFICSLTPRDAPVHWRDLTVRILSPAGEVILGPTLLEPRGLPFSDWPSNATGGPEVGYIEAAMAPEDADVNDAIVVWGLTEADEGATVQLFGADEMISMLQLPVDFHAG